MSALTGHMALGRHHSLSGLWTCDFIIQWPMWSPLEEILLGQWILFHFFYLFFSFTLMCLCVVFIYCSSYFIAHAHTASSLSGWAVLPALPCSFWAGSRFPHFWTNSVIISSDTAPFFLPLPPSGALIVYFLSKYKNPYFFLCFGLHIFF